MVGKLVVIVQSVNTDGHVIQTYTCREVSRDLPATQTIDLVGTLMQSKNVSKIVIRKIEDYKEGDIF